MSFLDSFRQLTTKHAIGYSFALVTSLFFCDSSLALSVHRDEHAIMFDEEHVRKTRHPEHDYYREYFESDEELARALIDYLYNHTIFGSLMPDGLEPPPIVHVSHDEIVDVAFGEHLSKDTDTSNIKIYGLYNYKTGQLLLLESINLHKQVGEGILLHELVHFFQYETGLSQEAHCIQELEPLAYRTESKFLEKYDHGHSISEAVIKKIGRCR